ncbi:MAG TPA: hypothetical protein VF456_25955 [Vicinamibacterales bacterium]
MDHEGRVQEIARLQRRLADLQLRDTELQSTLVEHAKSVRAVRARLGNPFFYSGARHGRPENATKTVAKYTGYKSHEPGLALVLEWMAINRELKTIRDRLLALHTDVTER